MSAEKHFITAVNADRLAMNSKGEQSRKWHRKAQVHATLALAEQQRAASLIALGKLKTPSGAMPFQYAVVQLVEPNGVALKPEIKGVLGL